MSQVVRNNATLEMAKSMVGETGGRSEELFAKNQAFSKEGLATFVETLAVYMVFARVDVNVRRPSFKRAQPAQMPPTVENEELCSLLTA